jgi:hypothetical protein
MGFGIRDLVFTGLQRAWEDGSHSTTSDRYR